MLEIRGLARRDPRAARGDRSVTIRHEILHSAWVADTAKFWIGNRTFGGGKPDLYAKHRAGECFGSTTKTAAPDEFQRTATGKIMRMVPARQAVEEVEALSASRSPA